MLLIGQRGAGRNEDVSMRQHPLEYITTATCEYLNVIRQHVIRPLETTGIVDSCIAAVLLVFGSICALSTPAA